MAEEDLIKSISQYEAQLSQIQLAVTSSAPGLDKDNLIALKSDIEELIKLTKENLDSLPKTSVQHSSDKQKTTQKDAFDEEYALFKAQLEESGAFESNEQSTSKGRASETIPDIQEDIKALQGMKCQAPHTHHWGETSYHNALVFGVEPADDVTRMDQIQVRVMFTNPTHREMLPCPYFLEGECRFSDEKCHFSHGELVFLSSLKEYKEPDFSVIRPGLRVLVKGTDKLWHRGVVQTGEQKGKCEVKLESSGKKSEMDLHDILPLSDGSEAHESDSSSSSSSSSSDSSKDDDSEGDVEMAAPEVDPYLVQRSLLNTPGSTALGEWEKHTKGIGSRLMAQMGYIIGTGLGKHGEGRLEPVDAVIFPAGKSLDHCMELREKAGGDKDMFKAEKKLKRLQKKQEELSKRQYEREKQQTNVFDFINTKLGGKKGDVHELVNQAAPGKNTLGKANGSKVIVLKSESSHNLNMVGFHVGEEIRKTERDVVKLQDSLSRHSHGSATYKIIAGKLQDKQGELNKLKASEKSIDQEKRARKDCKKLSVF